MKVLLLQLDGKLPNIALMRLSAHHRGIGDEVTLQHVRSIEGAARGMFDQWDKVYGSLIFEKTRPIAQRLLSEFPDAILGGTGWDESTTLENIGITTREQDYSHYPAFAASMGYTHRGCRFKCWFCKVPKTEGKISDYGSIEDIWRGDPWPRHLLILDNDFFGQKNWHKHVEAMNSGRFKVCMNQGINVRVLQDEQAAAWASIDYRDDGFKDKRIYTAWDAIGDEEILFRGLERLVKHGVRPDNLLVYMLIGAGETEGDRLHRHDRLVEFGARPYPMPFTRNDETRGFQRWSVKRIDRFVSWKDFEAANYRPEAFREATIEPSLFNSGEAAELVARAMGLR